ncbi:2-dehydropantoate 2-reductase [Leptospira perolatii]|uniref:2-dehydropantoate 2-reductase n=1 Tax=Leptospira perolatii TaxID=2023191 RepID=A0A2M9ZLT0_9LEPT|nr:2-dehydropantoate 2-reductase [Leptospira perolatii]PJZ69834.1 2-dehydropantoate 2-reductase [Leptospira perolatii]PJZ72951.1 2-dehydropantoate 2-reductase [Leptospira perolatii]
MRQLPQFAILGSGSIGTLIGAHLANAGYPVIFVGRERFQKEIELFGLSISDLKGRTFAIAPNQVRYVTDVKDTKGSDIFLVTVKSKDTEEIGDSLSKLLHSDSPNQSSIVVSFQNGIRNKEILQKHLQHMPDRVLAGMVPFNVVSKGKGQYHRGTSGNLLVENNKYGREIAKHLNAAQLGAGTNSNMNGVLWGKLLFNLNNSLNALSGIPLRQELSEKGFRMIFAEMISEGLRVLKHAGIRPARAGKLIPTLAPFVLNLPDWLFFRVASGMVKIDPEARSSMWEDLIQGRSTEIRNLNGEILDLAKTLGVEAPINATVVQLIEEAEQNPKSLNYSADELKRKIGLN